MNGDLRSTNLPMNDDTRSYEKYIKKLEEDLYSPNLSMSKLLRYIEQPDANFNFFKFLKSNLFIVSDFLKKIYKTTQDEQEAREFLEGEASDYTAIEVLYLFSETVNTMKKIDKIHNPYQGEDFLTMAVEKINKLNQIHKATNEKKVDKKLFEWFYYQYETAPGKFNDVCDFVADGFTKIYDIATTYFNSLSTYLTTIFYEESREENQPDLESKDERMAAEDPSSDHLTNDEKLDERLILRSPFQQCPNTTYIEYKQHLQILGDMHMIPPESIKSFVE